MNHHHPYHMVTPSPWPLITSLCTLNLLISFINWFNLHNPLMCIFNFIVMSISVAQWWRDIVRESTFQGYHTQMVKKLLKTGMILFIISELFFFISFFWTFFHLSIAPSMELGLMWPPYYITMFNPYDIPLLNSILLISSGITVTWSHNLILKNSQMSSSPLIMTIILGSTFSIIQFIEYNQASFTMNDSAFGSIFFMITGFHGLHVLIGITFLSSSLFRMNHFHFSKIHHIHFEAAIWYWHFVDVIWLMLYFLVYWLMY